jgi:hypothetical protein
MEDTSKYYWVEDDNYGFVPGKLIKLKLNQTNKKNGQKLNSKFTI